jgi:hypothetical protein
MDFYWLALGVLGVWRLTHLLQAEDGPWDLIVRLRGAVGHGFWGSLLDCFYCLSLWIAAPFAWFLGDSWKEIVLLWLALSGGASLLERLTGHGENSEVQYWEKEESDDGMLREEETPVSVRDRGGPKA